MAASASGDIEVRIQNLGQLFNSFDPSPFHERDMDEDAEQHIIGWARELSPHAAIRLIVDLPLSEAGKAEERGLASALAHYFAERAAQTQREMRELFRNGRRFLSISLPLLIACLFASQFAASLFGQGAVSKVLEESLILLGWVANWRPIEVFLFDWIPCRRTRDLYLRLAAADIVIRARSEKSPSP